MLPINNVLPTSTRWSRAKLREVSNYIIQIHTSIKSKVGNKLKSCIRPWDPLIIRAASLSLQCWKQWWCWEGVVGLSSDYEIKVDLKRIKWMLESNFSYFRISVLYIQNCRHMTLQCRLPGHYSHCPLCMYILQHILNMELFVLYKVLTF